MSKILKEKIEAIASNLRKVFEKIEKTYATKEELNSYATKVELNEVADSIRRWAAGTQYEVGDTVLVYYNKDAATYPNTQRMYRCKTAHTSKTLSTDYLNTYWEEIFQAARAVADEGGNNIKSYYAPIHTVVQTFATKKEMTGNFEEMRNLLFHSNVIKLEKGKTFPIEPNMLIMVTSNLKPDKEGDINCINYTSLNSDNEQTKRLSDDVSMILFFSVKTTEAIDGVDYDKMCRVACMSYRTTELLSVPSVKVLNSGVWSPQIINTSNDDNVEVYVYYMKQGQ